MKKARNIYEYFNLYSKEEIDIMLSKLSDSEKELVRLKNGDDLENPIESKELTHEKYELYYNTLIPKMKKLLANPNLEIRKTHKKLSEYIPEYDEIYINLALKCLTDKNIILLQRLFGIRFNKSFSNKECTKSDYINFKYNVLPKILKILDEKYGEHKNENSKQKVDLIISENHITKNDCIKLFDLLKTPYFVELTKVLNQNELIMIIFRFGYIDGKSFSLDEISKFLNIDFEEVVKISNKAFIIYKQQVNQFINDTLKNKTR